ncbi:hypothetical protein DPQ33_02205 [Oceanidesulfovibrio indonesiensis]|uniref:Lipid A biosynthesis acyltransferase n=1 Tax=Oceanidesulfovibrio indonesiensis TaxID=54767 RepID=A0A7M3MHM7_9BACT|nr:lysophospholipid acyltransferase family protein [Oceanidesulfovibrio indonesiensis]TVM19193.1 hypothetical protein DPQ33_02205 [Oceanidesulfovibrio indonesiensis]
MNLPRRVYLVLCYIFVRTTPRFWQLIQNRAVSYIYYLAWGSKRRIIAQNIGVIRNLPPTHPEVKRLTRKAFENYGLYLTDYVSIDILARKLTNKRVQEEDGYRHMRAALDRGNGAILVTPHLGNWELGGVTFARRGHAIHALTLKDEQADVQEFRDSMRKYFGISTLHIDPDDPGNVFKMARLLRQNEVLAMLGDRYEGGKKCVVEFFGRRTVFSCGAATLAMATGAAIVPAFVVLGPRGAYRAWMEEPLYPENAHGENNEAKITSMTQELARIFEKNIAQHPDQWYQFFNYWERYDVENTAY